MNLLKTKRVKLLEQQVLEYENVFRLTELFLLENGLVQEFSDFVHSVVSDFEKSQTPNITLIKK